MKIIPKTYKKILQAVLSIILLLAVFFVAAKDAGAKGGYWTTDVFTADRSIKGAQSFLSAEAGNSSNIFLNAFIDSGFIEDNYTNTEGYTEWEFEGDTYYFKIPVDLYNTGEIAKLNNADLSITVQLLVRYDPDRKRLIEPSARDYRGLNYYSPNMSEPAVVKEYRAFMDFMAENLSRRDAHIDCWICGNEVNAPDMWNFYGSDCMTYAGEGRWAVGNINLIMERYSKWYDIVFDAVKSRNPGARVCICLDHAWNETDLGKTISAKQFLDLFADKEGVSKDWCIAFHCYPAILYQTDIWSNHDLNPKSEDAKFIDGYNLEILTEYVKNNFGSNHRIMLTEQGFGIKQGEEKQAACMVYTFYKAKFDEMVDVMHIMKFGGSGFELGETSQTIWEYLDDGNDEHEQWIYDQVSETIGIDSWYEIVPNWKSQSELNSQKEEYLEENKYIFEGVDLSPVFDYDFYLENYPEVAAFFSDNPPTFYQMFWYFTRHGMSLEQQGSEKFNLEEYKNSHPGLEEKFGDNNVEYYKYYSLTHDVDEQSVRDFVTRFYTIILERDEINESETEYYTSALMLRELNGAEVAKAFVMSPEYEDKKDPDQAFVLKMYRAFFNRAADDVDFYMNLLNNGESREVILAGFVNSPEFKNMCSKYGINPGELIICSEEENNQNNSPDNLDTYIENLYECILGRPFDENGLQYWREQILSGEMYNAASAARIGFFESDEYINKNTDNNQFVTDCYRAFLNREPENDGLVYWTEKLDSGEYSRQEVIESGFGNSDEFKNILISYGLNVY